MNFADYLDEIERPAGTYDRGSAGLVSRAGFVVSAPFWDVLDQAASAPPVARTVVHEAYGQTDQDAQACIPPPLAERPTELSLDPDDIAFELDLDSVRSLHELSVLRRRFARLNHPDQMPEALKADANARMTIANAMIDAAASRFAAL